MKIKKYRAIFEVTDKELPDRTDESIEKITKERCEHEFPDGTYIKFLGINRVE